MATYYVWVTAALGNWLTEQGGAFPAATAAGLTLFMVDANQELDGVCKILLEIEASDEAAAERQAADQVLAAFVALGAVTTITQVVVQTPAEVEALENAWDSAPKPIRQGLALKELDVYRLAWLEAVMTRLGAPYGWRFVEDWQPELTRRLGTLNLRLEKWGDRVSLVIWRHDYSASLGFDRLTEDGLVEAFAFMVFQSNT